MKETLQTIVSGDPNDPPLYLGLVLAARYQTGYDLGLGGYCGLLLRKSMILVIPQGALRIHYPSVTSMVTIVSKTRIC